MHRDSVPVVFGFSLPGTAENKVKNLLPWGKCCCFNPGLLSEASVKALEFPASSKAARASPLLCLENRPGALLYVAASLWAGP